MNTDASSKCSVAWLPVVGGYEKSGLQTGIMKRTLSGGR